MSRIERIEARLFRMPLAEVLEDAMHGAHTHFELITATNRDADGAQGTGYTYTGGRGGRAILAMIEHDLAPFLTGRDGGAGAAGPRKFRPPPLSASAPFPYAGNAYFRRCARDARR